MENLIDLSLTGVTRYFNTLSILGYKSYSEVYKLILLLFIQDLLEEPFNIFINEEDYRTITNVLYCLYGTTCLIPYPKLLINTSIVQSLNKDSPRITEDCIIRYSENELIRLENK